MAASPPLPVLPAAPEDDAERFEGMWTRSSNLRAVFRVIERVADEDVTVLIRGETGTGKELVAHALHRLSHRREGPFRAINCAALPPALLESELFGHVRGAFTGAHRDTQGHFQLAHRGTLFLDEIAELPLELQAKLLRVLETHTILPVGAREPIPIDVRIVSATHRALRKEAEEGRFRADLMYRLRVIPIYLPPLREREADLPLLLRVFIDELNEAGRRRGRRQIGTISPEALRCLGRHDWPGNIRELRNVLTYAFIMGDGPVLRPEDLPPELLCGAGEAVAGTPAPEPEATSAPLDPDAAVEIARIKIALGDSGGHLGRTAESLGISRTTLWRRMKALGFD